MRNRERFNPTPSPEGEKKKRTKWHSVRDISKMAALSALLSSAEMGSAFAQEGPKKPEPADKQTMEQLKETAAGHVKEALGVIKEKGQESRLNNEIPYWSWKSPDEKTLIKVGYSKYDVNEPEWLVHESGDASIRFLDMNADGSVDRLINNQKPSSLGAEAKSLENHLYSFDPIDKLALEADITAEGGEDVKVYEIGSEHNETAIRVVDFQTGEASIYTGPDAARLAEFIQKQFTDSIQGVSEFLNK